MLERQILRLREHCRLVFYTGDSEQDFRARIVAGLAVLLSAFTLLLIRAGFAGGSLGVAGLLSTVPLCMGVVLWCLLGKRDINRSSLILVGSLLAVFTLLLFLSGGSMGGVFVALPLTVLLASLIASRRVAAWVTFGTIGMSAISTWLSTTDWVFPLLVEPTSAGMLGISSIIGSLMAFTAVFLYRHSAEQIRSRASQMQDRLESTNGELTSLLSEHLASAKLMFKVQEIGNLIGWWFEAKTGKVHYTASENGEFRSFDLYESDNETSTQSQLQTNLRELVARRIGSSGPWDDETQVNDAEGNPGWFRDSGDVEIDNGVISRVVGVLQDITSTKTLTDQLELHANYDELTGLYNRRMFWKAVAAEHAAFDGREAMSHLLFIDLDQFKLVNDTSGHVAGDRLLAIVSKVLLKNLHSSDVLGRVGGDEFGLIVRKRSAAMVADLADRLRRSIENIHFHWGGETFRVGASIGVIGIDPAHGSAEELQQLVDAVCYEAKLAGRNRVAFFEGGEEVIAAHRGEARWVQRIHDAITHNRFELFGQLIKPVADTGEPDRYEVLIRLRDSSNDRLIPPGAFLPAAERFGLSPQIDQWVLEHLLKRLYADPEIQHVNRKYWVNLSGNSIGDQKFADYLVETMRNSRLPKGMINFEITETAVIRNIEGASGLIAELRSMGCQFALDDFGSGLSSFGYLKKLPVDYLKIDGMFVREILNDEADRIFVQAINSIAKAMGIKTIAEFVENDEIFRLVKEIGVDYVQGFGIHRPEKLKFHEVKESLRQGVQNAG